MLEFFAVSFLPLIGCHLVGLFCLVLGFIELRRTIRLMRSAETVEATVVRIVSRSDENAQLFAKENEVIVISYPVFRFVDHTGETREVVSSNGSNKLKWKVGDQTTVLFDPNDPSSVVPNRAIDTWLVSVIVIMAGVAVMALGWLVALASWWQ